MYSITIKMLYKIRSIAYCTCILKGGLGTLNSWVLCHFLKAKSQSILWFRILSFVYISSLERLRYNSKKRVPRIKTIATPLVFSFILIIKCVSGSKKLLTIFGGSESKQKQNSKLVGPHQSFILHSNPKMECLTVFILIMLYFCEWLHQKLIYYSKLWKSSIWKGQASLESKNRRKRFDTEMGQI